MTPSKLHAFLTESNRIEGEGPPTKAQADEASAFLAVMAPEVKNLVWLVASIAPRAKLRDQRRPSRRSWPTCCSIWRAPTPTSGTSPNEKLHPFTDGNGRSGRLLWLWQTPSTTRR